MRTFMWSLGRLLKGSYYLWFMRAFVNVEGKRAIFIKDGQRVTCSSYAQHISPGSMFKS